MFRRALFQSVLRCAAMVPSGEQNTNTSLLKGRDSELEHLSPRRISEILDTYIVGQSEGKRAVAIALRNRWRRKQLPDGDLRKEVMPKNILLIGPTGVGKTEISRRMARITDAPFVKVEATKYTEVGFKGKDVEGIIEDLYANAKIKAKKALSAQREAEAEAMAIDNVYSNWMVRRRMNKLDEAVRNATPGVDWSKEESSASGSEGSTGALTTKKAGRKGRKKKNGGVADAENPADATASDTTTTTTSAEEEPTGSSSPSDSGSGGNSTTPTVDETSLEYFKQHCFTTFKDDLVTIELTSAAPAPKMPSSLPGMSGEIHWLGSLVGLDEPKKTKTTVTKKVSEAIPLSKQEALDKLIDQNQVKALARTLAEEEGVVFIDEIDKVVTEPNSPNSDVSSTGVQQDLLPLVEGSSVTLKDGTTIQTDNILFICSGAFHVVKTSDMLAELQGRLPVRVELKALTEEDFKRILTEPKFNLLEQQRQMMKTENVDVVFTEDGIKELARVTCVTNTQGQNIGARRLNTVLERVMDTYSYQCDDYAGKTVEITAAVVKEKTEKLMKNMDLAKYLL